MSPLVKEAAKTEMAQAITAGWKKNLYVRFCMFWKESYSQGGLLVREIQLVLEALVVPGHKTRQRAHG